MTNNGMLLLAGLLVFSAQVPAQTQPDPAAESKIYRSVDENGTVIFSDQPSQESASEEVQLRKPNAVPMKRVTLPEGNAGSNEKELAEAYRTLVITSPEPESTIRNPMEPVPVEVDLVPSLQDGHRLVLFDNGEEQPGLALNPMIRGSHSLVVKVLDAEGEVLIASSPVTVYLHRTTVQNQSNGAGAVAGPNTIGKPAGRADAAQTGGSASTGAPARGGARATTGSPATPSRQRPVLAPR